MRQVVRQHAIAAFALLGICVLALSNVLIDPERAIHEDLSFDWQGLVAAANEQIADGRFPHWNPYSLGGERLYANVHLALAYPGAILLRLLPFPVALVLTQLIHFYVTALAVYALAIRPLRLSPTAGVIGAAVFSYGGFCLGHFNHLNFTMGLPFLPLLILADLEFLVGRSQRRIWWLVGVACMTFMTLAGAVPILILAIVAHVLAFLFSVAAERRPMTLATVGNDLVLLVIQAVMAVGIASIQVLPTIDLYLDSARSLWHTESSASGGATWQTVLLQLLCPGLLGNLRDGHWGGAGHETLVFLGGMGLSLSAIAMIARPRSRLVWALVAAASLSVALALSDSPLARAVGYVLPIRMRQASRFLGLFHLAVALLAAYGLCTFICDVRDPRSRRRIATCCATTFIVMIAALATTLLWLRAGPIPLGSSQHRDRVGGANSAWAETANAELALSFLQAHPSLVVAGLLLACTSPLVLLVGVLVRHRRPVFSCIVVLWISAELFVFSRGTWAGLPRDEAALLRSSPILDYLERDLGSRRYFNAAVYPALWENRGAVHRLPNLDGYVGSQLNVSKAQARLREVGIGRTSVLNMYATHAILLRDRIESSTLKPRASDGVIVVHENLQALPLVWSPREVLFVESPEQAQATIASPDFDPEFLAVLEHRGGVEPALGQNESGIDAARVERWLPGEIAFISDRTTPGWLVVSTNYDRGWRVLVDGARTQPLRADVSLIGVRVPAGTVRVELIYSTPGLELGGLLSAISLLTTTAIALRWPRSSRD